MNVYDGIKLNCIFGVASSFEFNWQTLEEFSFVVVLR